MIGLEGAIVEVKVDISRGLPGLTIVGLPDAVVRSPRGRAMTVQQDDFAGPSSVTFKH
jgi:predicted ATPase with chaperone activity